MVTETVNLSESEWRKGERGEGWGPGGWDHQAAVIARLRNAHPGAGGHPRFICSVCRCPGAGPGPVVGMKEAGEKE